MDGTPVLIRRVIDAEIAGRRCDLRIEDGVIVAIADRSTVAMPGAPGTPDEAGTLDARGGALLPGLHDHHLHLFALAAALEGVDCGPTTADDAPALARVLADARPANV